MWAARVEMEHCINKPTFTIHLHGRMVHANKTALHNDERNVPTLPKTYYYSFSNRWVRVQKPQS